MLSTITAHRHTMVRLEIPTGQQFGRFRAAFEREAPAFDPAVLRGAQDWEEVVAALDDYAPHGLMVFASIDAGQLLRAAGHETQAIEYLLGNHAVAERMFRHQVATLLYAPLRVLVHADESGEAVFIIDQPSTVFAGLADDRVTPVGIELDQKVAALLEAAGVPVPAILNDHTDL
jgi:uncharacterized protein (DUF302 family)